MIPPGAVLALAASVALAAADSSSKRGLCFVPNKDFPSDNSIWDQRNSDLTWYYNYGPLPSPAYNDGSSSLEFVPMMWGVDSSNPKETSWLDQVTDLIDNEGANITHVLGFNEPDAPNSWGGSNVDPRVAARAWIANIEPLADRGIKLGLPGCTGGWGSLPWLRQFLGNCSDIISEGRDRKRNCTWDFLPVHWYDNFEGLASHIGERRAEYVFFSCILFLLRHHEPLLTDFFFSFFAARCRWPGVEIWITEYAYAHKPLEETQDFFNQTVEWFDSQDYIGRYSYFGAFRSDTSNVGPNAAFLNNDGDLTDIGAWYLGNDATGVDPESGGVGAVAPPRGSIAMLIALLALLAALS